MACTTWTFAYEDSENGYLIMWRDEGKVNPVTNESHNPVYELPLMHVSERDLVTLRKAAVEGKDVEIDIDPKQERIREIRVL